MRTIKRRRRDKERLGRSYSVVRGPCVYRGPCGRAAHGLCIEKEGAMPVVDTMKLTRDAIEAALQRQKLGTYRLVATLIAAALMTAAGVLIWATQITSDVERLKEPVVIEKECKWWQRC